MRKIEDQVAKASMMTTGIELGWYEPIDLFAVPSMWLVIADGLICCMGLVESDLSECTRQEET